jgi:hypothetical protein
VYKRNDYDKKPIQIYDMDLSKGEKIVILVGFALVLALLFAKWMFG